MLDLSGKTALIIGGTSGIGLATAELFARQGASTTVAGRNADKGLAAVDRLRAFPGRAAFVAADVRDETQVRNLVAQSAEEMGGLDILVNSAGSMNRTPLTDLDRADWDTILDTNLRGVFLACKHALVPMIEQGRGAIVNVASYLGAFGARETAPAYGASKAGVVSLTRSLALQVGPQGIRVNAVCPGFILTPPNEFILDEAPDPVAKEVEMARPYALGRLGRPHDVAFAILFLASDEAAWITGTSLLVDGGLTAG
jgi:NAD(P)-dependent dehydrogenase (short-subunit alcohol dehydrogenase family)